MVDLVSNNVIIVAGLLNYGVKDGIIVSKTDRPHQRS